jgi:DNA repair protein RadD
MTQKIIPRDYQEKSINAGLSIGKGKNGILVLPTGAGKSIVIAEIISRSGKKTVVLQPTKEILEQNLSKIQNYINPSDIGVFSASMNEKTVNKVTFATIGSIIKHKEKFQEFEQIIVDECHGVNSKGGQYEDFITSLGLPVIGLTATPYRMKYYLNSYSNKEPVVESRFLTRTRPRIFNTISHITQVQELFDNNFLCPVKYDYQNDYDSKKIKSNSTGQGFNDNALLKYNTEKSIVEKIVSAVKESKAAHILIFTQFREESSRIVAALSGVINCEEVSGETKKKDRESILERFKNGELRCVVNVGVLTVGFDFPELDCIMIGRPTKSIALFYQISGRGLRIAPSKKHCEIIDFCDNIKRFGEVNSFIIEDPSDGNGLWRLRSSVGFLTGVNLLTGKDLEERNTNTKKDKKLAESGDLLIPFGKHNGKKISELDIEYMRWCVDNFDKGNKWVKLFKKEIIRREVVE